MSVELTDQALLSLVRAALLLGFFNIGYFLWLWDGAHRRSAMPRRILTGILGNLIVLAAFGSVFVTRDFGWTDPGILIAVLAHGWMAESLVESTLATAGARFPRT